MSTTDRPDAGTDYDALSDWAENQMTLPAASTTAKRGRDAAAAGQALLDRIGGRPSLDPRHDRMNAVGGVSAEVESPIGAYLWWCEHVGADVLDLDALQEWDYLHADEMTDTERRTLTAWALSSGIFTAPDTAPRQQH